MRYSRADLLQLKDLHLTFDENISFPEDLSKKFDRIRRINKINVKGDGQYDPESQHLNINLQIKGDIIVGCDVTGEDVILPIDTASDVIYSFSKEDEDIDIIKAEKEHINLLETIFQLIMMEIPIKVVKEGKIEYPKGDGWEVITEEEFQKSRSHGDPRLQILKDYKPQ